MTPATGCGGGRGSDGGWWWGRPAPLDTGFRRYDGGEVRRPWALVRGGGSCLRGKTLRQAQGERFPKRAYRVWESGMRMVGGGGAKPGACLGKAFTGMTRAGGPSTGSGRTELRMAPATACVGLGARVSQSWAVVGRPPALAPRVLRPPVHPLRFPSGRTASLAPHLWIPAFAGMTRGECGIDECCWWRRGRPVVARRPPACAGMTSGGGPSTGSGRTESRSAPATRWGGSRGSDEGWWWGAPAPPLWIPAFAGKTVGGGGVAMGVWVKPRGRAMLGAAWVASDSVGSVGYGGLVAMIRSRT